ncbi:MAG: Gfo/Idh/MocA family oxidoreductase [Planctomycetes bacterium]|nr:Gfo/Idh/MocA family oxidoreductase [Planctomycetota bacterium]
MESRSPKAGRRAAARAPRRETPPPPGTPLRIGLIGQKFMGKAHSNAWSQAGRFFDLPRAVELTTIAARDGASLGAFARRFGWKQHTADWRELARDPEIDLVDVGTPNDVHREQALAMLEAGKHVACEKPLAGTLDDARAMRDAARKAGKRARTFVWFNYRRAPAVALAWQLLRENRLGKLVHVRAHYLQGWGGAGTPMSWRFQKKLAGSGAHGDLNAHIVDLARFLTGEEVTTIHGAHSRTFVKRRAVAGTSRTAASDVDDCVSFLASFRGGATAVFEATRLAPGHFNDNHIEVNGEHGSLRFSFEDMNLLEYYDGREPRRLQGWKRIQCTFGDAHPYAAHWWPEGHVLGYEHGFVNQAADIVRALSGAKPEVPLPDFEDAYETQRVLEAALVSAANRTAIPLSQIP